MLTTLLVYLTLHAHVAFVLNLLSIYFCNALSLM
jgi:hypothetical protein